MTLLVPPLRGLNKQTQRMVRVHNGTLHLWDGPNFRYAEGYHGGTSDRIAQVDFFSSLFWNQQIKKWKFTKTKKEENVALMAFVTDALQWGG